MAKDYSIRSEELKKLLSNVTSKFEAYKTSKLNSDLQEALKICGMAVRYARYNGNNDCYIMRTDIAYCLRQKAGLSIRDESNPNRYAEAKGQICEALQIYNFYYKKFPSSELNTEIQLSLNLLRDIAYNLKDGMLLEDVVNDLLDMQSLFTRFELKCLDSLYLIKFSKFKFVDAINICFDAIDLAKKHNKPCRTLYRHLAKAYLADLDYNLREKDNGEQLKYLEKNVESYLWLSYDENKKLYERSKHNPDINSKKYVERLIKDLIFMFAVRCKKSLLSGFELLNPKDYVLKQARLIGLTKNDYKYLKKLLDFKIADIIAGKNLPLDFDYFSDPPVIKITADQAKLLFPEQELLTIGGKSLFFEETENQARSPHNSSETMQLNKSTNQA